MKSLRNLSLAGLFACLVLCTSGMVQAQQSYQNRCATVGPYQGQCAQTQCCPTRCCPAENFAGSQTAPPAGAFAAPPQSGEVVGESSGFGIRGMSFTLPAITFELPSMRMPSFFRTRRDAHMRVDAANAPFVQGQAAVFGQIPGSFQGDNFAGNQASDECDDDNQADRFSEDDGCTSDSIRSNRTGKLPPAPAVSQVLKSLTPRERALMLQLLEERDRVARLESQMQKLAQAVEGNLYSLQDENSLFDSTRDSLQPANRRSTLEQPGASDARQIRQVEFAETFDAQR